MFGFFFHLKKICDALLKETYILLMYLVCLLFMFTLNFMRTFRCLASLSYNWAWRHMESWFQRLQKSWELLYCLGRRFAVGMQLTFMAPLQFNSCLSGRVPREYTLDGETERLQGFSSLPDASIHIAVSAGDDGYTDYNGGYGRLTKLGHIY